MSPDSTLAWLTNILKKYALKPVTTILTVADEANLRAQNMR